jgi:phosphoglycerol transferase MdoB-like AlkP superfamily enzyme
MGRRVYSEELLGISPASPFLTQFRAGVLGTLLHETDYMGQALDEPIDGRAVKQLKLRLNLPSSDAATFAGIPPDVVVIQSESFFNPDVLEEVPDTTPWLPSLHQATAVGVSGLMTVPTFGGGTLRTEFEVLTGIPLAAYPRMQFPYLQISRDTLPGLPHAFDDAGYRTVAIHGNSGEFWNRRYAFRSLGFSTFVTTHEFKPTGFKDGLFLSDHSMTEEIIAQLQQEQRPTFVFAISIEAHGPYKGAPVNDEAARMAIAMPAGLSRVGRDEFSRYAYHIAAADREFGRLWSYLEHRGRPYVLVFYGDHLPGFEKVYRELRFRNGQPAESQRVPWVAVSNVPGHGSTRNMYAWMLPQTVLELAHVKAPAYFSFAAAAGREAMGEADGADNSQLLDGLYSAARMQLDGAFDDDVDPKVRHAL